MSSGSSTRLVSIASNSVTSESAGKSDSISRVAGLERILTKESRASLSSETTEFNGMKSVRAHTKVDTGEVVRC